MDHEYDIKCSEGSKTSKTSKKESNQSKASAECIKHLTNQIRLLTEENKQYKQDIIQYQSEIEALKKSKNYEILNQPKTISVSKLHTQINKIDHMNQILKKQIEMLQISLNNECTKNITLVESLTNATNLSSINKEISYYQEFISKLTNDKNHLEKKNKSLTMQRKINNRKI